ncbi:MAG: TRAM domain-containing protein [Actinobacteria bacterium]|nr:TRAM domain-containing protein [Actinomycetota bacterium]
MFVEITRLFIVLAATAAGFAIGRGSTEDPGTGAIVGAVLGALIGYVIGGAVGRLLKRAVKSVEDEVRRAPPAEVLVGTLGAAVAGFVVALLSVPLAVLLPGNWGWPLVATFVWLGVYAGYVVAGHKSEELLALAGMSTRPLVRASRFGQGGAILDTSAIADGRLLGIATSGFLRDDLLVPHFVLDEVQAMADAQDITRRRRGRAGLETLEALRNELSVHILDEELPEVADVDAKLVALAKRLDLPLVTVDAALQSVAQLQGVACMNLNRLADHMKPTVVAGETVRVTLSKTGREDGQGVGFLADGTMVVVTDGAARVGSEADVKITGTTQTSGGRMLFGILAPE